MAAVLVDTNVLVYAHDRREPAKQQQVDNFILTWPILDTTAMVVQEAVRGVLAHRLPYYDAQLWATARLNQIPIVFSEDFADGRSLDGVRFVNPFSPEFALEAWT